MLNYLEAKVSEFTLRCFSKVIYVHIHVQLTPESREARGLIFHSALNQLGIRERILNDFRSQFLYPSNGAQNSCFASLRIGLGGDEEQRASLEKTKTKTKKNLVLWTFSSSAMGKWKSHRYEIRGLWLSYQMDEPSTHTHILPLFLPPSHPSVHSFFLPPIHSFTQSSFLPSIHPSIEPANQPASQHPPIHLSGIQSPICLFSIHPFIL